MTLLFGGTAEARRQHMNIDAYPAAYGVDEL